MSDHLNEASRIKWSSQNNGQPQIRRFIISLVNSLLYFVNNGVPKELPNYAIGLNTKDLG